MRRNFSLSTVLVSKWAMTFGACLQSVSLPLIIFGQTGSSSLLSWTFFAETLPWLVIAPWLTNILVSRIPDKYLFLICSMCKAVCVMSLAMVINNNVLVVLVFFVLGIFNAVSATVYSALLKYNVDGHQLSRILSVSLGIDDVFSIGAPLLVTYLVGTGYNSINFLYIHVVILFLSGLLSLQILSAKKPEKKDSFSLKLLMKETFTNYKLLKRRDAIYLTISECCRSFAEGMCIPLLIVYVIGRVSVNQEFFTLGLTIMSVAQVIMSFFYAYIKQKRENGFIINVGAVLMAIGFLLLIILAKPISYCISMVLLGLGMSIRQLVAENVLVEYYESFELSKAVSAYNSLVSLAYLFGYALSAFQSIVASVELYMVVGVCVLVAPLCIKKGRCKNGNSETHI